MKNYLEIDIKPMGYRRMTKKSVWAHKDYHEYMETIRKAAKKAKFVPSGALELSFWMPMPKSWSKKKKQEMKGRNHENKPDLDNLIKAVLDALFYKEKGGDSKVYSLMADKFWFEDPIGKIMIENIT